MDKPIPEAVLLPCPMCGSDAALNTCRTTEREFIRLNGRDTGHGVNCVDCGLNNRGFSYGYATAAEAIAAWNRRAITSAQQPMRQGGGEIPRFNPSDADRYRCFNCGLRIADHVPDEDGLRCKRDAVRQLREVTAPPSAPVGVEVRGVADTLIAAANNPVSSGGERGLRDLMKAQASRLHDLAQQPAAVDGAMVERAQQAYRDMAEAEGFKYDDECVEPHRTYMRAALTAALATQHQEPTT